MYYIFLLLAAFISCTTAVPLSEKEESPGSRITNGVNSSLNQFPYAVSIQANNATALATRGHRCGGALITLQHVLTTASCLHNIQVDGSSVLVAAANYQVFAGAVTLDSATERIRAIANFTIHPSFVGAPAYLNDIAIVTLTTPYLNTTANLSPLPLPAATFEARDWDTCNVAGWGAVAVNAQTSPVQQYASKYIYSQDLCTNVYSSFQSRPNIFPSMVCAASLNILSTGCTGDSGNALVCNGTLTGLLFYHNNCIDTSFPELYTRVSNYTQWIRSITGAGSSLTPTVFMVLLFAVSLVFNNFK